MEIKDKFIVINRKHLKNLEIVPRKVRAEFNFALFELAKHIPDNKYWVCNQDEPYADDVFEVISKGEDGKQERSTVTFKEWFFKTCKKVWQGPRLERRPWNAGEN